MRLLCPKDRRLKDRLHLKGSFAARAVERGRTGFLFSITPLKSIQQFKNREAGGRIGNS